MLLGRPLADEPGLPRSIVQFAMHGRRSVSLDEAGSDPRFADGPAARALGRCAAMCTPILPRGQAIGALYLDNELAAVALPRVYAAGPTSVNGSWTTTRIAVASSGSIRDRSAPSMARKAARSRWWSWLK